VEAARQIKPLFHNCYQQIDTDGNPNLGFYCIERYSKERFYSQVLFDPFEKQFYLPALFVDAGHYCKYIGQENKALVCFRVYI
jgi:hypothetical protein